MVPRLKVWVPIPWVNGKSQTVWFQCPKEVWMRCPGGWLTCPLNDYYAALLFRPTENWNLQIKPHISSVLKKIGL